jgi:hypothetical protein
VNRLQIFPKAVMVIGIIIVVSGVFAAGAGVYIQSFVTQQLASQNITTPDDASIPGVQVNSIPTALSMAEIIQHHAAASGDGLTYAQMGRFAVPDGSPAGTNNKDGAIALGLGFGLLGFVITGFGYALLGLVTPEVAERFGLKPIPVAS